MVKSEIFVKLYLPTERFVMDEHATRRLLIERENHVQPIVLVPKQRVWTETL